MRKVCHIFFFKCYLPEIRCADNASVYNVGQSNFSYEQNTTTEWCSSPMPCKEWIYENPNSFVAEVNKRKSLSFYRMKNRFNLFACFQFHLACQEWKRTLVGTAHTVGYMFGLTIVGSLSDRCFLNHIIM